MSPLDGLLLALLAVGVFHEAEQRLLWGLWTMRGLLEGECKIGLRLQSGRESGT